METTHSADTEYLVRKGSNYGYRISSILSFPAYTAYILARRGRASFSLNGLLQSTWIGGFVGMPSCLFHGATELHNQRIGAAGGGGIAFARYNFTNPEQVRVKRMETAYDVNPINFTRRFTNTTQTGRIRAEDHATIGGVLFAVLTPAVLWNRARIINCAFFA